MGPPTPTGDSNARAEAEDGPRRQARGDEWSSSPGPSPSEAWSEAASKIGEWREFAGYYTAARFDAIKLTVRKAGIYAALGLIAGFGAAAGAAVAVIFLLLGVAQGLGTLFGGRMWLGYLVTGAFLLIGMAAGMVIGMNLLARLMRNSTVRKYENRLRQQRQRFGHNVRDQANGPGRTNSEA